MAIPTGRGPNQLLRGFRPGFMEHLNGKGELGVYINQKYSEGERWTTSQRFFHAGSPQVKSFIDRLDEHLWQVLFVLKPGKMSWSHNGVDFLLSFLLRFWILQDTTKTQSAKSHRLRRRICTTGTYRIFSCSVTAKPPY